MTQDVYEPTLYFGISLRLNANPFTKKEGKEASSGDGDDDSGP